MRRGDRRRTALAAILLLALLVSARGARAEALVRGVDSVGHTVADLDRSVDFYTRVLDFEKTGEVEVEGEAYERLQGIVGLRLRAARLRLGDETLELTQVLAPEGRPLPADSRSHDRWFQHVAIVVGDMDRAYARLRQHGVRPVSTGPQTLPEWNPNAGGIRAFYFEDPDGHPLEILQFPPGKGAAKWHRPSGDLFLGIDHTAIVVADTRASLRVYRDALGFAVAGESENWGTEQEHLNAVPGARLRITTLRLAGAGPGIELLEYLSPRDGRPIPADQRANDIAHWQTRLIAADARAAAAALARARADFDSPGVVALPAAGLGFHAGLLARDPDGHALQVVQP